MKNTPYMCLYILYMCVIVWYYSISNIFYLRLLKYYQSEDINQMHTNTKVEGFFQRLVKIVVYFYHLREQQRFLIGCSSDHQKVIQFMICHVFEKTSHFSILYFIGILRPLSYFYLKYGYIIFCNIFCNSCEITMIISYISWSQQ